MGKECAQSEYAKGISARQRGLFIHEIANRKEIQSLELIAPCAGVYLRVAP